MFERLIFEMKCRWLDKITDPLLIKANWELAEGLASEKKIEYELNQNKIMAALCNERAVAISLQKDKKSAQKARLQEKQCIRIISKLEVKLSRLKDSIEPRRAKLLVLEERAKFDHIRKLAKDNKLDKEVARLKQLITTWNNRAILARQQSNPTLEHQAMDQSTVYKKQLDRLNAR